MKIVTAREMQEIDHAATEQHQISSLALMEQAGESLAAWSRLLLPADRRPRIVVLAGGGKNGGDGLVCARLLAKSGAEVSALVLAGKGLAPETQKNLQRLLEAKVPAEQSQHSMSEDWVRHLLGADLVIDALLGIGLSGPPREPVASAIHALNATGVKVLAADVPSGLEADTGEALHPTVRADLTVTFGLPKRGLLQSRAAEYVGRLEVDTIGFPAELLSGRGDALVYVDALEAAGWLPRRPMNAHKRSAGKVLIVGGSEQYHGAPLLAAGGAVRSGAGYVTVAYPRGLDGVMRQHLVEELCLPLPHRPPRPLGPAALPVLLAAARDHDALVLGPGLGRAAETQKLIRNFIHQVKGPRVLVIDADALHALEGLRLGNGSKERPVFVLTPHEGEAGGLLGLDPAAVSSDRWSSAQALARQYEAVVLLKGRHTVVVAPLGPMLVIGAGTPALATAGTGDVLAGAIAGFAAQRMVPREAAALAAFAHGLAGDLASPDPGGLGVRARDVADNLPLAIRQLRLHYRQPAGRER